MCVHGTYRERMIRHLIGLGILIAWLAVIYGLCALAALHVRRDVRRMENQGQ